MRMVIFLSVFLTLYGSLHFYALMKTGRAFGFHRGLTLPLALFMGVMVICPILVRVAERQGMEPVARVLAYAGYTWMGFLFLFVAAAAVLDLYRLLIYVGAHTLGGAFFKWTLSSKVLFFLAFFAAITAGVYGLIEARSIRTEHVVIVSPEIPEKLGRLRIVQISDVHLGLIVVEKGLSRILDVVRSAKPDILVSTGDLLDGQIDGIKELGKEFQKIKPPYGKFAVNGNHEYYVGIGKARKFCKAAGFVLLSNKTFDIPGILVIAGMDDLTANRYDLQGEFFEHQLLSRIPKNRFVLVLKHRPLLNEKSKGLFDLQLSGHTHKGQIFPFSMIIKMLFPVDAGLLKLANGAALYVSRGSGTWGPPMRVLSPPEVTIIDLVHGKRKKVDLQSSSD
jgi:predicted MPP superfamily phosphohydrolase